MPSMTEELSRIAAGIAASRRQRAQAGRARPGVVRERRREVAMMLQRATAARQRMGREQRRQAEADGRRRRDEVKTLMGHCARARAAQHRNRLDMAAAQRVQAAAFMRALTRDVAAMRDAFSAGQAARAGACRQLGRAVARQLAGYGRDRHDAIAAWTGRSARHRGRQATPGERERAS